jgi:hemoglobin
MAQDLSTSITRRNLVAGLALSAAPVALAGADNAYAQAKESTKETTSEKSLYERLGVYSPSRRWSITSATPS